MEVQLPDGAGRLALAFKDTTNSYKFFWFWALIEEIVRSKGADLSERQLYRMMVSLAWPLVERFKLSLGKLDKLTEEIESLREAKIPGLAEGSQSWDSILVILESNSDHSSLSPIYSRLRLYVKFRFLSPWFSGDNDAVVSEAAKDAGRSAPYFFSEDRKTVRVAPWFSSFVLEHKPVLDGWLRWHLCAYLTSRNPSALNVAAKLDAAYANPERGSLQQARAFWEEVRALNAGILLCPYSGEHLSEHYDVDHFLPWEFMGHDRLWNLIPARADLNRSKSDRIPSNFIDTFVTRQMEAVSRYLTVHRWVDSHQVRRAVDILDQYSLAENDVDNLAYLVDSGRSPEARKRLEDELRYLATLAQRQGFQTWPGPDQRAS